MYTFLCLKSHTFPPNNNISQQGASKHPHFFSPCWLQSTDLDQRSPRVDLSGVDPSFLQKQRFPPNFCRGRAPNCVGTQVCHPFFFLNSVCTSLSNFWILPYPRPPIQPCVMELQLAIGTFRFLSTTQAETHANKMHP